MRLLLLPDVTHYRDWKGKTYSDIISNYKYKSKNIIDIIYITGDLREIKEYLSKTTPNLIIFFITTCVNDHLGYDFVYDYGIPVYVCGLDLFNFEINRNNNFYKKCNGIIHFSHAKKLLQSYKDLFPEKKILSLKGRFINPEIYKNYGFKKNIHTN